MQTLSRTSIKPIHKRKAISKALRLIREEWYPQTKAYKESNISKWQRWYYLVKYSDLSLDIDKAIHDYNKSHKAERITRGERIWIIIIATYIAINIRYSSRN